MARWLVTGIAVQLIVVALMIHTFDSMIPRIVADDAFYYFQIARHIAAGDGSVFSPGEVTNGYHPLWMFCLVCLQSIGHFTPEGFVGAVLVLIVGCNGTAAWLLAHLGRAWGLSAERAALLAGLYLLSPWMVCVTLLGLETALVCLCLAGFLLAHQQRTWWRWGLWAGLVLLARTDSIFFVAPAAAVLLWQRQWLVIPASGLAACIVAPWLAWNWLTFGTIIQASATAMTGVTAYGMGGTTVRDWATLLAHATIDHLYRLWISPFIYHNTAFIASRTWSILILLILGASVLWAYLSRIRAPWLLGGPALALFAFYTDVRLFVQV